MKITAKKIQPVFLCAIVYFLLIFAGCSEQTDKKKTDSYNNEESRHEISILYPNWAEGIAFTHLAKVALTDKGYDVKTTPLEPGPIYATLARGEADLMLDGWLPHTHDEYWKKYGDKLEKIGESFSDGTTGLVVPQYMKISSIEELNDHVEELNGEIIGIESGAGIHRNTEIAIKEYKLNFKQITSSDPAMLAALKRAYEKQEPIVITGWKPHYKWADFDLKYLNDPKSIYPADVCAIISRKGFVSQNPVIGKFFMNFNLSETQLYDLMDKIKGADDPVDGAKEWYLNNKKLVESWMPREMK